MADLRTRYIEDYAGGLLNIARQELSSTGEVLAQDGFVDGLSLFVEDGRGVKSGLRLGSSVAECVDPITDTGVLNVRTADRTYAKVRDLKAFATAVASAQGALTESVTESFTNFEGAFESLEADVQTYRTQVTEAIDSTDLAVTNLSSRVDSLSSSLASTDTSLSSLSDRTTSIETLLSDVQVVTSEQSVSGSTQIINNTSAGTINIASSRYYAISSIKTNVPAWVTIYTDSISRGSEARAEGNPAPLNGGVVLDVITSSGNLLHKILPFKIGTGDDELFYIRAVNKSGSSVAVNVTVTYIPL